MHVKFTNQYFHESILVTDDQTFNLQKSVPSKKAFQVGCIPPTFLMGGGCSPEGRPPWRKTPLRQTLDADPPGVRPFSVGRPPTGT